VTIKIVTDSTCDLPEAVIAQYGITVVPLHIHFGGRSYLDGVDLSGREFYQDMLVDTPAPTTAAPAPHKFRHVYQTLADQGATEILSIHVAGNLSATLNNARLSAQQFTPVPVTVIDSQQLSLGTGFLVHTAAKAAARGQPAAQIVARLQAQITQTHVFAVLDSLDFLRRSGRVNPLLAALGGLLQIKPLFKMHCGTITYQKLRTRKQAVRQLIHRLKLLTPTEYIAVIHSHAPELAGALRRQMQPLLPGDIPLVEVSPIIGAHVGPGDRRTVGAARSVR